MKYFKVILLIALSLCAFGQDEENKKDEDEGFLNSLWKLRKTTNEESDKKIIRDNEVDNDLLEKLLNKWETLEKTESTSEKHLLIENYLEELKKVLAKTENAKQFIEKDGLEKVFLKIFKSPEESVVIKGLVTLGETTYNNYDIQLLCLKAGILETLETMLNEIPNENVVLRVVYALGSVIKGCPEAQNRFFNSSGLEALWRSTRSASVRLRFILSSLLDGLLGESESAFEIGNQEGKKIYGEINLKEKLFEGHHFCHLIKNAFEDIVSSGMKQVTRSLVRILHRHRADCALAYDRETRKCFSALLETPGFEDDVALIKETIAEIYKAREEL